MTSQCLYVLMATLDTKCPKLAKIGLRMYFMCFYSFCPGDQVTRTCEWEIWSVSGRLPTVWESRDTCICIILVDSQPHYLPEAGRFICNRISLNEVDCSTTLYFSLFSYDYF